MFSVIIPLYNKGSFILETVNSVLGQTNPNFEIIIVNDGSTDDSLSIVQDISDSRIRIIDKPNGGVSSARNRGIFESKEEWITFLDGDDTWVANHLEEYAKVIKTQSINWVISGYVSKKGTKKFAQLYDTEGRLDNVFNDLLNGLRIHTSTVCVSKHFFHKYPDLRFREGVNNSEDREVWYKICCIDKSPYYIRKILSIYILDDSNSLTKNTSTCQDHYLSLYEKIAQFDIFRTMDDENKLKLKRYISYFNTRAIKGYYSRNSKMKHSHKMHLSKTQWRILKSTSFLPTLLKKIIIRL
ncbi:glycosyltransferase family 2 protein [Pedobacter antarcticus]|uniref:glycosyltransferase family 2 protein n=1 Tax=Pedobacter antarcticus TaxID=34086 RepID=UPI00088EE9DD|nr:glycosyltransferase family 2 protein [Pedobacter antarcticus]SDM17313.1 Glycosyltransferase involved in cell wall bisynthesis [Pedobacter antarcticus]